MSTLKPLIIILGPTASGKTEMGLRLAKKYNGKIINADSRQIYTEMDIGTGKTDIKYWILNIERKNNAKNNIQYPISNIPIHLINIKNPNQKFSLSQYKKLAIKTIDSIHKQGKIPILVGGTGLYISAIVNNLEIPKVAPNKKIRGRLEKHTEKFLFKKLKKVDQKSAEIIGINNKRKLIRALEVYEITGKPFSAQQVKGDPLFNILQIGITLDRKKLYEKIDQRVDKMIKNGLIEETKKLSKKYSFDLPAMSGIGYREIGLYLQNKIALEEAIQKMKFRTHRYARRQMTWFKRDEKIKWVENYKEAERLINKFLKK
ncbi:MAG: tRNA (adenosine(37)-N6)-dimethylallyltransferase MiaA [Patescibacteria group bacterium]|nr:tRNA (adenosine(37)-N6)-dimethylallyltransferase MiaA [Patescibacteria group bacterium]